MKGVQCYELFGGIALKIHTFSFFFHLLLFSKEVFVIRLTKTILLTLPCVSLDYVSV